MYVPFKCLPDVSHTKIERNSADSYNYLSESIKILQTKSTWSCTFADAKHLVVKATHRSEALFNEIITYAIFIFVNSIQKLLLHELFLIIHGYDQHVSKVNLHLPGLKKQRAYVYN